MDVDWSSPEKSLEAIKSLIKAIPDFPKPGILFRDIMPLFQVPDAVSALVNMLTAYIEIHFPETEVVLGLDARGFLLGPMIAVNLSKPFVPIRKKGKLPGQCVSAEYVKEYGTDIFEMQANAVKENQKAVIFDDLLATGGTMAAACKLVKNVGGNVLGCICIIELLELEGRKKFDAPIHSLIQY